MATTITNAVLTVSINENINLNGSQQGSSNTFSISGINEISKRITFWPYVAVDTSANR